MSHNHQPELDFSNGFGRKADPEAERSGDGSGDLGPAETLAIGSLEAAGATEPDNSGSPDLRSQTDLPGQDNAQAWGDGSDLVQTGRSQAFVLRGRPGAVTRFRKGLVVGLSLGLCLSALGLTSFALRDRKSKAVAQQPSEPSSAKVAPAALTGLPRDYAGSRLLGPPASLEEALTGRAPSPDLSSASPGEAVSSGQAPAPPGGSAQAQLAPASALLMPTTFNRSIDDKSAGPDGQSVASMSVAQDLAAQNSNERHGLDHSRARTHRLAAGAIIAAQLLTGLNSEIPGPVVAQVAADIYDSQTGRHRLIPAGSKLLGLYEPATAPGQNRISLVFKTLVLPSGQAIELGDAQASDRQGFGGLTDQVDRHGARIFIDTTLLGAAGLARGDLAASQDDDLGSALRRAMGDGTSRAADALLERAVRQGPTLRVRPGWPLRLILQHALELEGEESS